jgi:hypothetical protein
MKRTTNYTRACVLLLAGLLHPQLAHTQTVDLANPAGRTKADGTVIGGMAGFCLSRGDLNGDIYNRDLVICAPEANGAQGEVRILYGWLPSLNDFELGAAGVTLVGAAAGDRFGAAANTGFVTTLELPQPASARDLIVGAPDAEGGRGAAYLFAANTLHGTVAASAAVYKVVGRPGDRLGSAVELADLNGDGYRELVLGAPGSGRVYVIDYRRHLGVSTQQLDVTPADATYSGAGIGGVLFGGDLDGDSIFDLAMGAPTANGEAGAVHIVFGRPGALAGAPSAALPLATGGATMTGADSGDRLGAELWINDVDADDRGDLIVSAPGGDGPANSRSNAGEVHIVFGGPGLPAVVSADVMLYGAAAGDRLGGSLSAGDITRDEPDDIAMLATGANGGKGAVFVYFGRHRSQFPAVVDLASGANRRILADASDAPAASVLVWEVTGEGAEDIVVGVPEAATAAGAAAGRLYFSISPTIQAAPGAISLTLAQGTSAPIDLEIRSLGMPAVLWAARSNSTWLTGSPSGQVSAAVAAPAQLTATAGSLPPGTYTGSITVASNSGDLLQTVVVTVTLTVTPGTSSTVHRNAFGLPSPVEEGSPGGVATAVGENVLVTPVRDVLVHFAGVVSSGQTSVTLSSSQSTQPMGSGVRYGPWIYRISTTANVSGPVTVAIAYEDFAAQSEAAIRLYQGDRDITARADTDRNVIWSVPLTSLAESIYLVVPRPRIPSWSVSRTLPAPAGSTLTWTVNADGDGAPLQYKVWHYRENTGTWSVVQDYDSTNTYTWQTGRADEGRHAVQIWVRRPDSPSTWDAYVATDLFQLTAPAPLQVTSVTASETSPAPAGRSITWTAEATGGVGPIEYRVWRYAGGQWTMVRDYAADSSYTWHTTPADAGVAALQFWARSADSTAAYEAFYGTGLFTLSAPQALSVQGTLTPAGPVRAGTPLQYHAVTTGGTGPLQYQFWQHSAGIGWRIVQSWSPNSTFAWTPAAADVGTHSIQLWVRNGGSTNDWDGYAATGITVTAPSAPQVVSFNSSLPLPAPAGSSITWSTEAVSTGGGVEYTYWLYRQSTGTWTRVRDYSTDGRFTLETNPGEADTYALQVWIRNVGSAASYETSQATGYFQLK